MVGLILFNCLIALLSGCIIIFSNRGNFHLRQIMCWPQKRFKMWKPVTALLVALAAAVACMIPRVAVLWIFAWGASLVALGFLLWCNQNTSDLFATAMQKALGLVMGRSGAQKWMAKRRRSIDVDRGMLRTFHRASAVAPFVMFGLAVLVWILGFIILLIERM